MNESESQVHHAPNVPLPKHERAQGNPAAGNGGPPTYVDPVCGMTVTAKSDKAINYQGVTYYFCSDKCKAKFSADPAQFLKSKTTPLTTSTARYSGPAPAGVVYTCPMHPEIRQIGPGTCPKCGMTLESLVATTEEDRKSVV